MSIRLGPRATDLLIAWGSIAETHRTSRGYDVTQPTRSEEFQSRLDQFTTDPTENNFESLWHTELLASAGEWHPPTITNLWPGTLEELATFFDEIRTGDQYDPEWERRASWGSIVSEIYSRCVPDSPVVSNQARRGLQKLGIEPANGFEPTRDQLVSFRDVYLDLAGHVTGPTDRPIPVFEEIDQFFSLVTTVTSDDIATEATGPRGELYTALRGYPGPPSGDRGPIEIDFEAASPAIDGHIAARRNNAYAGHEGEHWAGQHYETWKWDFAEYITEHVTTSYSLENLSPDELESFFDDFWANSDEYTDTSKLSTPVPQYLLGRWGVVQFQDFKEHCLDDPETAATVLSVLFSEEQHLVDRLQQFHDFAASDEVSDGNLLRIATTFLMGAYPDEYVNFQYQRFDTLFSECSNLESLEMGFDARQYYRIVLACRDLRDALREELPEASMLDVHTLIRLYQDFRGD